LLSTLQMEGVAVLNLKRKKEFKGHNKLKS